MPLSPGDRLGPYEILTAIGAGGMGEVYSARDTRLDRTVAVKVLPSHLSHDPMLRQRFEREARAVSSLNHPHICTLHDIGREGETDFLVMEHLEGQTLAARLESGPLPVDETLRYAIQIADALDKAHRQGLVHRDLKPGNIMLTKAGAKLLDFGLAKSTLAPVSGPSGVTATPTMTSPLTAEGAIVGTFQYMAPEQLDGREADARSDIFAFGAVLYEMLTGKKTFSGRTQASLIASILKEEPRPLAELAPMTPPALERLVRGCLAKDPDERRQSAHDLLLELRWVTEGGSQAGVPAPVARQRRSRERMAWAVAAVGLLASAAALGFILTRPAPAPARIVRAFVPMPAGTRMNLGSAQPGPVSISPDGMMLAFAARSAKGEVMLYVRRIDELEARPLPGTERGAYPFWSPDSAMIGFLSGDRKMKKIAAAGGPAQTVCEAPNMKGASWAPDGTILFAPAHNTGIFKVADIGGEPEPVTKLDESKKETSHRFPWFLPDEKHFLYLARSGSSQEYAIRIGSIDSEETRQLTTAQSNAEYASGHLLFLKDRTLMAQQFDTDRLELVGGAFPVAENVRYEPRAALGVFSVSTNGMLTYLEGSADPGRELVWVDREGKRLGVVGEKAVYSDISVSPDAKYVAAVVDDRQSEGTDIWIVEMERGIRTRFTFEPADDINPHWSPDGDRIVFTSLRTGPANIYVKSVAGTGMEEPLLPSDTEAFARDWSRDGKWLLYTALGKETGLDIWALPMDGSEPKPILTTPTVETNPVFSPDGRWFAYQSNESGVSEIYAMPFPGPGRKWQISTDGGLAPRWLDAGEILYFDTESQFHSVKVTVGNDTLGVDKPQLLFADAFFEDYSPARDGKRILMATGTQQVAPVPLTLVVNWTAALKSGSRR